MPELSAHSCPLCLSLLSSADEAARHSLVGCKATCLLCEKHDFRMRLSTIESAEKHYFNAHPGELLRCKSVECGQFFVDRASYRRHETECLTSLGGVERKRNQVHGKDARQQKGPGNGKRNQASPAISKSGSGLSDSKLNRGKGVGKDAKTKMINGRKPKKAPKQLQFFSSKCRLCSAALTDFESMVLHCLSDHSCGFICQFCGYMDFEKPSERHLGHHSQVEPSDSKFACLFCAVRTGRKPEMTKHLNEMHKELVTELSCHVKGCFALFPTKECLLLHQAVLGHRSAEITAAPILGTEPKAVPACTTDRPASSASGPAEAPATADVDHDYNTFVPKDTGLTSRISLIQTSPSDASNPKHFYIPSATSRPFFPRRPTHQDFADAAKSAISVVSGPFNFPPPPVLPPPVALNPTFRQPQPAHFSVVSSLASDLSNPYCMTLPSHGFFGITSRLGNSLCDIPSSAPRTEDRIKEEQVGSSLPVPVATTPDPERTTTELSGEGTVIAARPGEMPTEGEKCNEPQPSLDLPDVHVRLRRIDDVSSAEDPLESDSNKTFHSSSSVLKAEPGQLPSSTSAKRRHATASNHKRKVARLSPIERLETSEEESGSEDSPETRPRRKSLRISRHGKTRKRRTSHEIFKVNRATQTSDGGCERCEERHRQMHGLKKVCRIAKAYALRTLSFADDADC